MLSNISLSQPFTNCVYQRNSVGVATIPVAGTVAKGLESVTATFSPVVGGKEVVQTIPVDKDGNYSGGVKVPGGWYSLIVSSASGIINVNRVGSGEVFVLFGHSYMQGGHDENHQLPATDERVITLLDDQSTRSFSFGQLTTKVGPFHGAPDAWGQLGDLLVKRLGVPVLFFGCAYGGSNLQMNLQVINGEHLTQEPPGYPGFISRQPFAPLENVFDNYLPYTGVRAVLFEHGYNDRGTSTDVFTNELKQFFDYLRGHWNKPDLAAILVQEQLTPVPGSLYDVPTAQAIDRFLSSYPNVYKGPDFNSSDWLGMFSQHDHLFGAAIDLFALDWSKSISDTFLQRSTPYESEKVTDVFPVVLFNAPTASIKPVDWAILAGAALCLIGVFIWHKKSLMWGFLLLGLLSLGRLTGKV